MIGYIIVGLVILCFLYIAILYFINSKKIKQKQSKKETTDKKADTTKQQKVEPKSNVVEVKSQIIKGTMFEEAIKEAEKAGFKYETEQFINTASKRIDNSRLKLDREEFVSEIKQAGYSRLKPQKLVNEDIKSSTIEAEKDLSKDKNESIGKQINDLSPELKALLINDVLNRKY